ncbi:ATP-dependent zinc metalloprotease FtsH [Bradyrhizobium sp. WYCCWR 13023]|uniref:ATP-dependent zinc metalloprotease FtsH n=1 Tax=Bradyrhizobium zhengyangense TaxID=2911009 RepID=A0A9X1UFP3_9BRAD|nr:ATP-dependent zinc metalloprotease FtsH [Bradyrhizobium zhengyangense]MCG2626702.1 ATP-dependent zinc metalloprotease FtsH [Bradyrhizobium zhengyangense]MCG2638210.1 ATP-dependent zinc metalloprotease FtsH [Bradyrhizobium zhengyangense]MCG2666609.1 ATP-dependent zinc metalloprotease FtsH [Bradyrhizobium zhengyangense]
MAIIFAGSMLLVALQFLFATYNSIETIPYSQFEQLLAQEKIAEVSVGPDTIQGKLKEQLPSGKSAFVTARVDMSLADKLAQKGVSVTGVPGSGALQSLLSWIFPVVVFVVIWYWIGRGMTGRQGFGGLMAIGKSRAKVYAEKDIKVTFADVAGVDDAKFELQEVVSFLRDPGSYGRLGAHVPKGILLVGPPGTGKTLLARAVAGEAGVPFFSISGSEFVEMFVGVGAARVRDLFEQARKAAPCIIFVDELDALGRSRGPLSFSSHDEKEQTLNQLLSELDGFDPSVGVILLAATNRPEILDPALLRAGRFDRQVLVDRPDKTGRIAILRVHVRKIRMGEEVDLEKVAGLTTGFTGADLANLVNEAAIAATRRGAAEVSFVDFVAAIERIVAGVEKKSRVLGKEERRRVAYHEMGHALVAASLPGVDPVQKVSIIPRGIGALGYTIQRPTEDRFLLTIEELKNRIAVLMGGRASERLIFDGAISTGAADDLQRATEVAIEMVTKYGMDETVGQRTYAPKPQAFLAAQDAVVTAAEATGREIDLAVRNLIEDGDRRARDILQRRRADLDAGVELLIANETVTAEQFTPLLGKSIEKNESIAA